MSTPLHDWLLQGDVAIQYQVHRDLLGTDRPDLRARIATEGWGAAFLARRRPDGHWGRTFYQPKWTSTHYTLLDLCHLGIDPRHPDIQATVHKVATEEKSTDGGINPARSLPMSDVCVNGMFMTYAAYFGLGETHFQSIVDFLLAQRMPDGGFNCFSNRQGAVHSSLHSTLSVAEGIQAYLDQGYRYRAAELATAGDHAREFILLHRFYRSDRTGEVINPAFLRYPYPSRWHYDILRALDHFQAVRAPWDDRMQPAIDRLLEKRTPAGTWNLPAQYPGELHFQMETPGKPSRWNTLRALRVLKHFGGTE